MSALFVNPSSSGLRGFFQFLVCLIAQQVRAEHRSQRRATTVEANSATMKAIPSGTSISRPSIPLEEQRDKADDNDQR